MTTIGICLNFELLSRLEIKENVLRLIEHIYLLEKTEEFCPVSWQLAGSEIFIKLIGAQSAPPPDIFC